MVDHRTPTERELEILKILWVRGEATVRAVYEEMSRSAPIVQNTVQAFLRTMEEKQLVTHRVAGRSFIYRPLVKRDQTNRNLATNLLDRVFDGAIDQMVQSVISAQQPTTAEIARLEELLQTAKQNANQNSLKGERS
ncbi:Penicillinase repressor [Symmachiella macrocystis]|uniref:Penicillinase repressor n=1 Tax=Symmachiella macrocystis TaxID=2527985 RepID=A0A5C6B589_9PLAN|nr:BlaI/MecI/CopY family transcriptional regulator [Symmachiella macrocystis]TWU06651.1 Penicillinase repressor [Symmachiella macrocystis]